MAFTEIKCMKMSEENLIEGKLKKEVELKEEEIKKLISNDYKLKKLDRIILSDIFKKGKITPDENIYSAEVSAIPILKDANWINIKDSINELWLLKLIQKIDEEGKKWYKLTEKGNQIAVLINQIKDLKNKLKQEEEEKLEIKEEEEKKGNPLEDLADETEQPFRIFDKADVVEGIYFVLVYALDKNYRYKPLIATSRGEIVEIKDNEELLLKSGFKKNEISQEDKYFFFEYETKEQRYYFKLKNKPQFDERFGITNISNKAIKMLLEKKQIDEKKLFADVSTTIQQYYDHADRREYSIISCFVILPYIEQVLQHTIYLLLQGQEDTGKSTLQRILAKLQLYGFFGGKKSLAVLVRYLDFYSCKLGIDEFEKLDQKNKTMAEGVLNSGHYGDGTYDFVNMEQKDIRKSIVSLNTFGFKSFSCNNLYGFERSFISRCYPLICVRQNRKLKNILDRETAEKEKPVFQDMVDRCFVYCTTNWKKIVESVKHEKEKFEKENTFGRVTDRNSIILGIIRHFNPENYESVKELLGNKEGLTKQEELETENGIMLWSLCDLFKQQKQQEKTTITVTNKQIVELMQEQMGFSDEDKSKYSKRVGKLCKRLNLFKRSDQIKRSKEGMIYTIYFSDFVDILKRNNYQDILQELNYTTTLTSQTTSENEESVVSEEMKNETYIKDKMEIFREIINEISKETNSVYAYRKDIIKKGKEKGLTEDELIWLIDYAKNYGMIAQKAGEDAYSLV